MDTSKQYIKMCDCPEIWANWALPPLDDDLYALDGHVYLNHVRKLIAEEADNAIWLPRQDQIQEMMGIKTANDFRDKIDNMFYTRDGGLYDTMEDKWFVEEIKTPEQLWLAFYMYEKHGLIWSLKEEKWIKNEKNSL